MAGGGSQPSAWDTNTSVRMGRSSLGFPRAPFPLALGG